MFGIQKPFHFTLKHQVNALHERRRKPVLTFNDESVSNRLRLQDLNPRDTFQFDEPIASKHTAQHICMVIDDPHTYARTSARLKIEKGSVAIFNLNLGCVGIISGMRPVTGVSVDVSKPRPCK